MKTYLIYFVDHNRDVNEQALSLGKQMSEGEYTIDETSEQKDRNRDLARYFEDRYDDLNEFVNPFGKEESEELGIDWDDDSEDSFVLGDSQGIELKLVGNYFFMKLPQLKTMWESDIVDQRVVEIISYCQKHYTVLAFDEDDKELLDDISESSNI
ncbi:MAG: hypothetical protein P8L44_07385 [Opitutales bacterium]|jgi:hypothetical protein|nr:hypothetical protein [Opitutales bacterium]MDG2167735.1 hypothetical protein [Opitutales bacterium]